MPHIRDREKWVQGVEETKQSPEAAAIETLLKLSKNKASDIRKMLDRARDSGELAHPDLGSELQALEEARQCLLAAQRIFMNRNMEEV